MTRKQVQSDRQKPPAAGNGAPDRHAEQDQKGETTMRASTVNIPQNALAWHGHRPSADKCRPSIESIKVHLAGHQGFPDSESFRIEGFDDFVRRRLELRKHVYSIII